MERRKEPDKLRPLVVQTGIMLIIAAVIFVIVCVWLFKRLLA